MKNCALVHDLCSYSKASLTVAIPILESLGIEACPFPTAILSTQTDGYENYYFYNLEKQLEKIVENLNKLQIKFDCIYSGFIPDISGMDIVRQLIINNDGQGKIIIDPVMGDDGIFYNSMNNAFLEGMKKLVSLADIITPNITEAEFLTGTEHREYYNKNDIVNMAYKLRKLLKKGSYFVITGIIMEQKKDCITVAFSHNHEVYFLSHQKIMASYSGTGDMFASIMTGLVLDGMDFKNSVNKAALLTSEAVKCSLNGGRTHQQGISTTAVIPLLYRDQEINKLISQAYKG